MYEVLDVKRMMRVKSTVVRNRQRIPKAAAGRSNPANGVEWCALILVEQGLSLEKLNAIPAGSIIKLCIQDKTLWEIFIPKDYKKSIKMLAKRLDAVAYL